MIHVSCAVEGDYVPHCAAMLHSVFHHAGDEAVHVHYLHGPDLTEESRAGLVDMVDSLGGAIDFLAIADERVAGLPTKGFTGKATWYRIFLPELLPDVDRILYLDSDLIVMDSLQPLWRTDLGDNYVAAVTNVLQHNHVHRPALLGMQRPEEYFNAGVLLMNLDRMRRDGCAAALLDYGVTNAGTPKLEWRDQDALNVVLGRGRLALHPRWNCMTAVLMFDQSNEIFGEKAVEQARRAPGIRHFEGPAANKPWHYLCTRELRDVYMEHRAATPWPRVRIEGRTARNVMRRLRSRVRP